MQSYEFENLPKALRFSLKGDVNIFIGSEIIFSIIGSRIDLQYDFLFQLKDDTIFE